MSLKIYPTKSHQISSISGGKHSFFFFLGGHPKHQTKLFVFIFLPTFAGKEMAPESIRGRSRLKQNIQAGFFVEREPW